MVDAIHIMCSWATVLVYFSFPFVMALIICGITMLFDDPAKSKQDTSNKKEDDMTHWTKKDTLGAIIVVLWSIGLLVLMSQVSANHNAVKTNAVATTKEQKFEVTSIKNHLFTFINQKGKKISYYTDNLTISKKDAAESSSNKDYVPVDEPDGLSYDRRLVLLVEDNNADTPYYLEKYDEMNSDFTAKLFFFSKNGHFTYYRFSTKPNELHVNHEIYNRLKLEMGYVYTNEEG